MKQPHLICPLWIAAAIGLLGFVDVARAQPNILWITVEDMSPTLGCYGDEFATTPNLDAFAAQSARYTHAFATAPVCSPSRACLINACIATTQGTHPMRSQFPLPTSMVGFPALLREAGYYTSNNVKTDYNSAAEASIIAASWDENSDTADWRGREPDQPFFCVMNLMTTHQSRTMVWPYEQFKTEIQSQLTDLRPNDPSKVPVPPYYPDTPLVRKTMARFYDCVTVMDQQVGEILDRLESDGLADETIVFFYSDHGNGMPRHKRALFDSGMRVPLMIRFPKQHNNQSPCDRGGTVDRLVSFEDFGPTVLSLAGIRDVPDFMRGHAFLGPLDVLRRQYVFGHRDRVDEIMDMARSVRSRDFLYIRNYMPHLGYNQQSAWIDQGEIRRDFYALADAGTASPAQEQYLRSHRPVEELYDCVADPQNLNNLAAAAQYQSVLRRMRNVQRANLVRSRDLGLVPEIELWERSYGTTPMQWAHGDGFAVNVIADAAALVGSNRQQEIASALQHSEAAVRYWGVVSCRQISPLPEDLARHVEKAMDDPSLAVQIEAASAVAQRSANRSVALAKLGKLLEHDNETVVLHAARAVEMLADPSMQAPMQRLADRFADKPGDIAWFIRFTTSGYLNRL